MSAVESRRRHSSASALYSARPRHTKVRVMDLCSRSATRSVVDKSMQSQPQRPPHHANLSRSLFQNPWMLADTTQSTSKSTYWPAFSASANFSTISTFLTNPGISLVRVNKSEIHPQPPIKLVKPDWGHSNLTTAPSEPNLRATWLGHAVRRSRPATAQFVVARCTTLTQRFFPSRVSSSSFRVLQQVKMKNHLASCSTPSSRTVSALCHG